MNSSQRKDATEIEAADDRRIRATLAGDMDAVADCFDDDLVYVHASGPQDDKKKLLQFLKSGPVRYRGLRRDDAMTRVFGDVGVMIGHFTADVTANGTDRSIKASFTSVWLRQGGAWRMLAWQATPVGAPPH